MNDGDLKLGYIAEHVWKDFEISPLLLNIGGFSFSFESEIIKVFPFPQQEKWRDGPCFFLGSKVDPHFS